MNYSSYEIITPPTTLPVTLAFIKEHSRLDPADTSQDAYLTTLIEAATEVAESEMKRILINTKFRTFRDRFSSIIELRRSKLQAIDLFEYMVNDSFITVPTTIYYNTVESDYSRILLKEGQSYPNDIDNKMQSIKIEFIAGYGVAETNIPKDIKVALANHVALTYEDRGDCNSENLPAETRRIYKKYRIPELIGEIDYYVY